MATTRVQLPDGNIGEFPAEMKPEDIQAVLAKQFPPPAPPETISHKALGMAKDFGKGVLESVGGTLDTIGSPASYVAHKMGFAQETPEQEKQREDLFKPVNATQAVGAGLGDALQAMIPVEKAIPFVGAAGKAIGKFAEPVLNKVSEFNQAWNPLPLRSRAVNAMKLIENEAKDVPVDMRNTEPAVSKYLQHVDTGGERGGPVMNKLAQRMGDFEQGPILYPEARQFYKNIGRESARPGFLRRAMEPPGMADTRRVVGGAGNALKTDIGNAAESIGRGQDLANAMKEYADNAKLRKLGMIGVKAGAGVAAEEAARRSGLLGKVTRGVIGQ